MHNKFRRHFLGPTLILLTLLFAPNVIHAAGDLSFEGRVIFPRNNDHFLDEKVNKDLRQKEQVEREISLPGYDPGKGIEIDWEMWDRFFGRSEPDETQTVDRYTSAYNDRGNVADDPVAPEAAIYNNVDMDKIKITTFSGKGEEKGKKGGDSSSNRNDKEKNNGDEEKKSNNDDEDKDGEISKEDLEEIVRVKKAIDEVDLICLGDEPLSLELGANDFVLTINQYGCALVFVELLKEVMAKLDPISAEAITLEKQSVITTKKQDRITIEISGSTKFELPDSSIDFVHEVEMILEKLQKSCSSIHSKVEMQMKLLYSSKDYFIITKKQFDRLLHYIEAYRKNSMKTRPVLPRETKKQLVSGREKFKQIELKARAPEEIANLIYGNLDGVVLLPQHNARELIPDGVSKSTSKYGWDIYKTNDLKTGIEKPNVYVAVLNFKNPLDAYVYAHFLTKVGLPAQNVFNTKLKCPAIKLILRLNNKDTPRKVNKIKRKLARVGAIIKKYYSLPDK